mmetsp:Transcript_38943/g.57907  ORF Transcript_38943/g.57907 Transcript_38943/m.57907 type:complete len:90 (+) Transcript_38943:177-446(+)
MAAHLRTELASIGPLYLWMKSQLQKVRHLEDTTGLDFSSTEWRMSLQQKKFRQLKDTPGFDFSSNGLTEDQFKRLAALQRSSSCDRDWR